MYFSKIDLKLTLKWDYKICDKNSKIESVKSL